MGGPCASTSLRASAKRLHQPYHCGERAWAKVKNRAYLALRAFTLEGARALGQGGLAAGREATALNRPRDQEPPPAAKRLSRTKPVAQGAQLRNPLRPPQPWRGR
jgi:cytosine/adenosine deaminase-related metal-dependent hydrolase